VLAIKRFLGAVKLVCVLVHRRGISAMLLGNWFGTKDVDEFARALARDLIGRLPPQDAGASKKHTAERMNNAREALRARVIAFARTHKVNWYRKAHFGNTFKWELREAGYDEKFVDSWTYDVLLFVSSK
jgi:hypothetical protein